MKNNQQYHGLKSGKTKDGVFKSNKKKPANKTGKQEMMYKNGTYKS